MRRGEIYTVDLGPGIGREPHGVCPVVVVSDDFFNSLSWVVVVVPGEDAATSVYRRTGVLVTAAESGLSFDVRFQAGYIRSLDLSRFPAQPDGAVPANTMTDIDAALRSVLDLR